MDDAMANQGIRGGCEAADLPLISVITVVFNCAQFLEETIKSVISQTYPNIEYIIIDGGSTDGTVEIIRKYEKDIDYWVSEKDAGIYAAMNKGLMKSNGSWVVFINSGDILLSEFSFAISGLMNVTDSVEVALFGVNVCNDFGNLLFVKRPSELQRSNFLFRMPACHQGILYKRIPMKNYDTEYKIIADKVHLFRIFMDSGLCAINIFPTVISAYRLGGYSERMRKLYHKEEARFFSEVTHSGKTGEFSSLAYVWLRHYSYRISCWLKSLSEA